MTPLLMAMVVAGAPNLEVEPTGPPPRWKESRSQWRLLSGPGPSAPWSGSLAPGANPASKVWLAQVQEALEDLQHQATIDKTQRRLLITRAGNPVVNLPEGGREVPISWNEGKSHALDTRQLLEEYLGQVQTRK